MSVRVPEPTRHRFTVTEYHRMAETGLLAPDARVELIDGEIIDMPPIGIEHAGSVTWLNNRLVSAVAGRAVVSPRNPVRLSDLSEPQPDLAVLLPRDDNYLKSAVTPADVVLMIEVAQSSLRYDRNRKLPLYATHGVAAVWLLDVAGVSLTVARDPSGGRYATVDTYERDAPALRDLPCGTLEDVRVDLSGLLAAL